MGRRTLTPLESELRPLGSDPLDVTPRLRDRLRTRREEREPPKTRLGAIGEGLFRLATWFALACAGAELIDLFIVRSVALGFYCVGGILLTMGIGSNAGMGRAVPRYTYEDGKFVPRLNPSVACLIVGVLVLATGVAIEAL